MCLCLCHGDRAAVALQIRMGGCCGKAAQARAPASQPRDTDEKRTAAWGGCAEKLISRAEVIP